MLIMPCLFIEMWLFLYWRSLCPELVLLSAPELVFSLNKSLSIASLNIFFDSMLEFAVGCKFIWSSEVCDGLRIHAASCVLRSFDFDLRLLSNGHEVVDHGGVN